MGCLCNNQVSFQLNSLEGYSILLPTSEGLDTISVGHLSNNSFSCVQVQDHITFGIIERLSSEICHPLEKEI